MLKLRRIDVERSGEIFSKIEKYKQILVQKNKTRSDNTFRLTRSNGFQ